MALAGRGLAQRSRQPRGIEGSSVAADAVSPAREFPVDRARDPFGRIRDPLFDGGLGCGTFLHECPNADNRQQAAGQNRRQREDADKAAPDPPTREWTGLALMTDSPLITRVTNTIGAGGSPGAQPTKGQGEGG